MATTFTGLKLQGYLGKFGRTELSDISGIAWRNFKRDNNYYFDEFDNFINL